MPSEQLIIMIEKQEQGIKTEKPGGKMYTKKNVGICLLKDSKKTKGIKMPKISAGTINTDRIPKVDTNMTVRMPKVYFIINLHYTRKSGLFTSI
ncbi:17448_t:CDS:2 [Dentiscutata heterogama]|uniref:17448_t:CDS:1 n=1 Tax=Dentiscutata heterogama TaxID=1316150 RepID=A0ACA9K9K5_9GLOM|nr:17448_t:CDS:2 [Dentiscutata heterogama]